MVQQQDTPGSLSDVPKRSTHFFQTIGKKKFLYIVLPLILINAGVAHLLIDQIALRADAQSVMVKDETAVAQDADAVSDNTQVAEEEISSDPVITTYTVKSGDTLSGIAEKFDISVNTIRWANDLTEKTSKITIGDELVILPVSGIEYTVKKGDTLSGIAAKFDVSQDDILKYNDIEKNAIKVGTELIVPGAEPIVAKPPVKKATAPAPKTTSAAKSTSESSKTPHTSSEESPKSGSDYVVPVHGILTQGIHDRTAVDFGVPVGTPVKSFKEGTVIIAKPSGYNGGYGSYIVVNHEGSCQTQYSHLSTVSVSVGDKVSMGETIGLSGNTGRSTGPHLHFNVNNCGGNPITKYKVGTKF